MILPAVLLLGPAPVQGQGSGAVTRERTAFAAWLSSAPVSPLAAIALRPIGTGLTLGPEGPDVVVPEIDPTRVVEEHGVVRLGQAGHWVSLPRDQPRAVGSVFLVASGSPGRTSLTVFAKAHAAKQPSWYPYDSSLVLIAILEPSERKGGFWVLGLDGIDAPAGEAGLVAVPDQGGNARLRVYRLGDPDDEEASLQIYFRDSTSGAGSYPAGRFVELEPLGGGRYRLDFNRARNPFCAYSTVYPCPAPWPGNTLTRAIRAGEQYHP